MFNPLARRLRFASSQRVGVVNAPAGFLESLGDLPEDVTVSRRITGAFDMIFFLLRTLRPWKRNYRSASANRIHTDSFESAS